MTKLSARLCDRWTAHSFFDWGIPFMSAVVYVVRSPLLTLSRALFPSDGSAVVLSLEDPLLPGRVLRATTTTGLKEGERLSYEQVLAIILAGKKTMTL